MSKLSTFSTMIRTIPKEWRLLPLETFAATQYGTSLPSSGNGAVGLVGMKNIKNGIVADLSEVDFVNLSQKDLTLLKLHNRDLLFNRTNSKELVGKTALFDSTDGREYVFASYLIRIASDRSVVLPEFLCYYMNSTVTQSLMKSLATPGVSQYNINPTTLAKRLLVPVPTLEEQRAVVTCLEIWDGAIERLNALISRKIDFKQGLMQQLLRGARRFEEFVVSDSTYQTRYGSFPTDWPYTQIRAIAHEVNARSSDPTSTTVLSCTKYEGLVDSLQYFGKRVFSDDTAQYKLVKRDQFAYATNHIEEGSIGLLSHRDAGLVSPMYTVFKTNDQVHPPFLYALFKTDLYRHIFQANTNASVDRRGGLRWQEFALLHVALPGIGEQRKIAAFLTDCQREIQLLNRERDLLEKEKRWLLDKLAFGQMRLDAQRSVDHEQSVASDR